MTQRTVGLTLIEVLIALAIIGIAMTAIIKATTQTIRATSYLQDKTIAMWVGQQVINEVRAGVLVLPEDGEKSQQTTTMLGKTWYWEGDQTSTASAAVKKITVNVFLHHDDDNATPIMSLESYVYQPAN